MPTPEKLATIQQIRDRLERGKSVVVAEYRGLNVQEMTELRRKSREAGVEFKVLKNTLTARAAQELGIEGIDEYLSGPNGFAFGYDDPVAAAKVIADFAKDHDDLVIKAGILDGSVISMERVKYLADLPSREVLLSNVVRGMQAPMAGLVNVLQGTIRNVVYALDAVRQKKESEAGA